LTFTMSLVVQIEVVSNSRIALRFGKTPDDVVSLAEKRMPVIEGFGLCLGQRRIVWHAVLGFQRGLAKRTIWFFSGKH
jgi:hypothetical protein